MNPEITDLYDQGGGKFAPEQLHGLVECSNAAYHAGPGVSKSKLDAIAISPLNYWSEHIDPDRPPREEKRHFSVGDGTHKLVLEPGTFERTYGVEFDKKAFPDALDTIDEMKSALAAKHIMVGKGSKAELIRMVREELPDAQIIEDLKYTHNAKLAGKTLIKAEDYRGMLGMLRAVERHHTAADLLRGGSVEQAFYWRDMDGVLRKCRTDNITADGAWITDLKTTDDVSEAGFGWKIYQHRYHVQAAYYLDILRALYGDDAPRGFAFIAVQKTRPFDVAVHYLTEDQIQAGRLLYQRDMSLLAQCQRLDYWPGADGGRVIQAKLPQRAYDILYSAA